MTVEEWKNKNGYKKDYGSCYDCVYGKLNEDWTYSCKRLNRSVGQKVILGESMTEMQLMRCKNFK